MDGWADAPDELEQATWRTLLVFSSALLGALALPGLLSGEPTGPLLIAGALLIAGGAAPIRDATLHRRAPVAAAGAAMLPWLLAMPLFEREGMIVPAVMALACALLLRAILPSEPPSSVQREAPPTTDGWSEQDGRRLPW